VHFLFHFYCPSGQYGIRIRLFCFKINIKNGFEYFQSLIACNSLAKENFSWSPLGAGKMFRRVVITGENL
jgi:hypothetical protein